MTDQLSKYNLIKIIGEGSYGEVWLVSEKHNFKRQLVLKKIGLKNANRKQLDAARLERALMRQLKHPNIVEYYNSWEEPTHMYLVMSYCVNGDLYNYLKRQRVPLSEKQIVEWFIQITMALSYLHEKNILHRDLKTQNIFLAKSMIIKLGDLGIAKQLNSKNDMANTLIGTPYYMSPELFAKKPYNFKSDIWSLGCVVYEMATLKLAFSARNYDQLTYKILRGFMPEMPHMYSVDLSRIIQSLLQPRPDQRPSTQRILRNNYITSYIERFLQGSKVKSRDKTSSSASKPNSANKMRRSPNNDRPISPIKSLGHSPNHSLKKQLKPSQAGAKAGKESKENSIENLLELVAAHPDKRVHKNSEQTVLEKQIEEKNIVVLSSLEDDSSVASIPNIHEDISELKLNAKERRREKHRQLGHMTIILGDTNDVVLNNRRKRNQKQQDLSNIQLPELEPEEDSDDETRVSCMEVSEVIQNMNNTLRQSQHFIHKDDVDGNENNIVKSKGPTELEEETLNRTKIQDERYAEIRKELMREVGFESLYKAYQIIDDLNSNQEEDLKALLRSKFNRYNGKIYWLKLYEDG